MEESGQERRDAQKHRDYGSAEQVSEGCWSIGNFDVVAASIETGLALCGQDENGREVTYNLSSQEVLQFSDLIEQYRTAIERGFEKFGADPDPSPSVFIRSGDGPTQIPTNKSALGPSP